MILLKLSLLKIKCNVWPKAKMTPSALAQKLKSFSDMPLLEARWILSEVQSEKKILNILKRRQKGEPLSKILGHKGFWKGDFITSKDVLDPRSDSETLIEAVLKTLPNKSIPYSFVDIGTGSGCLLISLLMEYKNAKAVGLDLSEKALKIAQKNAQKNGVKAKFIKKDMRTLNDSFDFGISNPPYIPTKNIEKLDKNVRLYDPLMALDGGKNGLDYYHTLSQIKSIPLLFLEIGKGQKTAICQLFKKAGWQLLSTHKDLGGIIRVLVFQKNTCKR